METTERSTPRPVWGRALRRMEGLPLDPPTEEERQDAIRILEAQPQWEQIDDVMGNVSSEFGVALGRTLADRLRPLVEEAERIHHECSL